VLTSLDKHFIPAYTLGGILLTDDAKAPDVGIKLLMKGFRNVPTRWEIPFTIGIIHFLYTQEYKEAARWFLLTSKYPDAYPYVVKLASFCLQKGYEPQRGIEIWENIYKIGKNNRIWQQKAVEGIVKILDILVYQYKKEKGIEPKTINELVKEGYIIRFPYLEGEVSFYIKKGQVFVR
jgi:hypothetical protein